MGEKTWNGDFLPWSVHFLRFFAEAWFLDQQLLPLGFLFSSHNSGTADEPRSS